MRSVWAVLYVFLCCIGNHEASNDVLELVDTRIGTGGLGFGTGSQLPGPQMPFGMVRPGPDTINVENIWLKWRHCGGYYPDDYYVRVFSHTHMVGAGTPDYGNIGMLPTYERPTKDSLKDYGWRLHFEDEQFKVGYYSTYLRRPLDPRDDAILAELTAAMYTGVHRYTYPTYDGHKRAPQIVFYPSTSVPAKGCHNSSMTVDMTTNTISGWANIHGPMSARFGGMTIYFYTTFASDIKIAGAKLWADGNFVSSNVHTVTGKDIGAYIEFPAATTKTVEMYVAISFVSAENAKLNWQYDTNNGKLGFDEIYGSTQAAWRKALSVINITKWNPQDTYQHDVAVKLYTGLYHASMAPTTFSESNGMYMGFDKKTHTIKGRKYYTDMSIWDVHRSQFPLLSVIQPDVLNDVANSLLLMTEQGGSLPKWPMAYGYTSAMIGTHAVIVIADAYFRNCTNWDPKEAWKIMWRACTETQKNAGRSHISDWLKLGYIPVDKDGQGVCKTVAYAYDDAILANFGAAIRAPSANISQLQKTGKNYVNVWEPTKKFFCPRKSDGTWSCPITWIDVFDPHYTEGDAWHWRFQVQQQPSAQEKLFGGQPEMVKQLDEFITRSYEDPSNFLPNPYYWAGNEEDLLAPWIFSWIGHPELTQKHTRKLVDTKYTLTTGGIPGNDDYGTMSAWLVFATLGFYPQAGTDTYAIGSPSVLGEVKLGIPTSGKILTVSTVNASQKNVYVQKLMWNGKQWKSPFFKHSDLLKGGVMEYTMGPTPAKAFSA